MKKTLLFLLLFIPIQPLLTDTVYKTVNKHGPVFSDQPSSGAEQVDIGELQVIYGPRDPDREGEPKKSLKKKKDPEEKYAGIEISSPAEDAAIRSNMGKLNVSVRTKPDLKKGDRIHIFMDGLTVASGTNTQYTIPNIDRGTHTLEAQIVDKAGQTIISSPSVQFHMLRFHKK